jgi:hypothetical protein
MELEIIRKAYNELEKSAAEVFQELTSLLEVIIH